jgi:hypothetical protein
MMRKLTMLLAVMLMALSMLAVPASADGHNQRSCEAAGGTWTSTRGEKLCVTTTEEEGKNTKFECTTTEEEGGQGNLKNKPTYDDSEESTSPQPGSGKCPPGQFK